MWGTAPENAAWNLIRVAITAVCDYVQINILILLTNYNCDSVCFIKKINVFHVLREKIINEIEIRTNNITYFVTSDFNANL